MELAILNGTYRDTNIKARKQIHALLTLVLFLIAKVTISAQKSPHLDVSVRYLSVTFMLTLSISLPLPVLC